MDKICSLLAVKMVIVKTGVAKREMCYCRGSEKYKILVARSFVSVLQDLHHDTEQISNYLLS